MRHLTFANVLACTALFLALSGAAYAAKTMLPKNSVKAPQLASGAVTTPKLRNGAVTTAKLRNGAVNATKLAPASIGSGQLANGSVRSGQLGGGVVTEGKIKNGAVSESKLGANSVSTGKIQDGAVTGAKIAPTVLAQLVKNVTYTTVASVSNADDVPKSATAVCPIGKQVVGGGAKVAGTSTTVAVTESAPTAVDAAGKRTGWSATAIEIAPEANPWSVEAYAVCAEF